MKVPEYNIEPQQFWNNPYPDLAHMRTLSPICFVPQLGATLLTRHNDISQCEKKVAVFSSDQPGGLMTLLMGQNMMRKDGEPHLAERRQTLPSVSAPTVKNVWRSRFEEDTSQLLDSLEKSQSIDLVREYAMPVSANALRHITGLTNMAPQQLDGVSQGMIDGIANYAGDKDVESRCREATSLIDDCIDTMLPIVTDHPDSSMLSKLTQAGQPMESVRANIKLAISGGQNEPRDAIAGCVWALLTHTDQLESVRARKVTWLQVFEEYVRWISPIGMSPRRIAQTFSWNDVEFKSESRAFFMFGSGNRDEAVFADPDEFDVTRDTSKSLSFGAGPHYCVGAAVSRGLIADVALPMLFDRFPDLALDGDVKFGGWAFRGPLSVPVQLHL